MLRFTAHPGQRALPATAFCPPALTLGPFFVLNCPHERATQNPGPDDRRGFFAWNPPSPQLWQLVDGEPQAMAPAKPHPWRNNRPSSVT